MTDSLQDTAPNLPDDIEALRALVLATFAERDAAVSERDILQTQNDRLRHLLLKLTRMQFGARSERLPEEQLQLFFRETFGPGTELHPRQFQQQMTQPVILCL